MRKIDCSSLKSLDRQPFEIEIQAAYDGLEPLVLQLRPLSLMQQMESASKAHQAFALWIKPSPDIPEDRAESLKLETPDPTLLPDGRRLHGVTSMLLNWATLIHSAQVEEAYMVSEILALMLSDEYGSGFKEPVERLVSGTGSKESPLPLRVAT